jgi:hypothetical protein
MAMEAHRRSNETWMYAGVVALIVIAIAVVWFYAQ